MSTDPNLTPNSQNDGEKPSLMSEAETKTAEQIAAEAKAAESAAPVEWKDDPAKSAEENAKGKADFEKAAADKKAADEAKTKEADAAKAANDTKANPFKVEEIKVPDGMVLDEAVTKDFTALVNEFGIPRDAVAKLVDLQTGFMKSISERDTANWTKTQDEWKAAVMADPAIGGAKNPEAMARVAFLRDTYGKDIPDLKQALDITGAGNHPAFIKWVNNISQDLVEGSVVPVNQPGGVGQTLAQKIYDKT